jgi:hypothetical protein
MSGQSPGYETAMCFGSVAGGLLRAKKGESPFALAITAERKGYSLDWTASSLKS